MSRLAPAAALAAALALAALAYARVLGGPFLFDDLHAVESNLAIRDLGLFWRLAFWPGFVEAGRPVTELTFALDHAAAGLDPRRFHATSLLLHLGVTLLAWRLARALLGRAGAPRAEGVAAAAAGLFALHPLQSQAVAYVAQRAELLGSAFHLATVLALLAADRARGRRAWLLAGLAALAYALGLGSKPVAATAPLAFLLVAAAEPPGAAPPAGPTPWRRRLALALPLLALGLAHAALSLAALGGDPDAGFAVPGLSPWSYLLTQARVVATYLRLLAWPAGQSGDWDVRPSTSLAEPAVLASALLLLALAGGAALLLARGRGAGRAAGAGGLWFLLLLAPSSSVVPLADLLVEHRPYLASLGVFVAAAAGAERALARWRWRGAPLAAAALVGVTWGAAAAALHARNAVWESRRAFWEDAARKAPGKARPLLSLSEDSLRAGRPREALEEARAGLLRAGADRSMHAALLANAGVALLALGRVAEAEEALRAGLAWEPGSAHLRVNLAIACLRTGRPAEAEALARRAAEEAALPEAWNALGDALAAQGRAAEACPAWGRAASLAADPALRRMALAARARAGCPPRP